MPNQKLPPAVLLIDKKESTAQQIRRIIEAQGMKLWYAKDEHEGINLMYDRSPHILLLDYHSSENNYLDLMKFIRKTPFYHDMPILFLTEKIEKDHIRKAIASGADEIVTYPLKASVLLQKLKKQLKLHELPIVKINEKINVKAIGNIIQINELEMVLQSSLKIKDNSILKVESSYLNGLGADASRNRSNGPAKVMNPGIYRSRIRLEGMDEETAQNIRKIKVVKE